MSTPNKSVYYIPEGSKVAADLYDLRVVDRNITNGRVNPKEYNKHLSSLEDSSSYAEKLPYEQVVETESRDSMDDSISDEDLSF
ncbi:MAG TPA: hypothetical protein VM901_02710 [Bdellovibrionota bacterium]|jgi:hypothetical protein|nr:hypothetical protein [Bdellovibrionota bacterium]